MSREYFSPGSFNEIQRSGTRSIPPFQAPHVFTSSAAEEGGVSTVKSFSDNTNHHGVPPSSTAAPVNEFYGPGPQTSTSQPRPSPQPSRKNIAPAFDRRPPSPSSLLFRPGPAIPEANNGQQRSPSGFLNRPRYEPPVPPPNPTHNVPVLNNRPPSPSSFLFRPGPAIPEAYDWQQPSPSSFLSRPRQQPSGPPPPWRPSSPSSFLYSPGPAIPEAHDLRPPAPSGFLSRPLHQPPAPPAGPSYPYPTTLTPLSQLSGPQQRLIACPACHTHNLTRLEYEKGDATKRRCKQMAFLGGVGAAVPWVLGSRQDLVHSCMGCAVRLAVQRWDRAKEGLGEVEVLVVVPGGEGEGGGGVKQVEVGGGAVGELSAVDERGLAELGGRLRADAEMEGEGAARELPGDGAG